MDVKNVLVIKLREVGEGVGALRTESKWVRTEIIMKEQGWRKVQENGEIREKWRN